MFWEEGPEDWRLWTVLQLGLETCPPPLTLHCPRMAPGFQLCSSTPTISTDLEALPPRLRSQEGGFLCEEKNLAWIAT